MTPSSSESNFANTTSAWPSAPVPQPGATWTRPVLPDPSSALEASRLDVYADQLLSRNPDDQLPETDLESLLEATSAASTPLPPKKNMPEIARILGRATQPLFACKACRYTTTQQRYLTKHIRVHTKEKPYKCKHCNQAFTQSSSRRTHEKTHTEGQSFKCGPCGKSFTQKTSLTRHSSTACKANTLIAKTELKLHKCSACDYTTPLRGNLTRHFKVHSGVKPFGCPHCDYSAAQKNNLAIHLKTH